MKKYKTYEHNLNNFQHVEMFVFSIFLNKILQIHICIFVHIFYICIYVFMHAVLFEV